MILRLASIGLIIWCVYMIPSHFLDLDFFKIKKINIGETSENLKQELTSFAESIYNKNIWQVNVGDLKSRLSKDVRLESVDIRNEKAGELNIKVQEKDFLYYAQIDKRIYLMDKTGKIFGYFQEREKRELPLIVSKDGKNIAGLVEILSMLRDYSFYDAISQIYEVNENRIEIILIDGTKIITNREVDKKKYKVAIALYFELIKTKKIAYIDIRFQDFIIRYLEAENGRK